MTDKTKKPLTPRLSKLTSAITQANTKGPKNYVPFHKRKNTAFAPEQPDRITPPVPKAPKRPISLPKLKCLDEDTADKKT